MGRLKSKEGIESNPEIWTARSSYYPRVLESRWKIKDYRMKELERGADTGIPEGQMLRCLRKDYMQLVSSSLKGEHLIVGAR